MNKVIEIWSTYPPPFGGVSVHSMRLFNNLRNKHNIIFENFNGATHSPQNYVFAVKCQFIKVFSYLFKPNRIIHLHSNRLIVWFLMILYPKSTKIIVTIHNQNLKKNLSYYKNILLQIFFRKVSYIFINDSEFAKYLIDKYTIDTKKIVIVPAFIPPTEDESKSLPLEIESFLTRFKKIVSSFAWKLYKSDGKDVYGIEQIIDAFSFINENDKTVGLVLLIPIIKDQFFFKKIINKINNYKLDEFVLIYNSHIPNAFDLWRRSNLFLRCTSSDIEGLSIKEALYFNVPVIASDVVKRPNGVHLYTYGDIKHLSTLMYEILKNLDDQSHSYNLQTYNLENGLTVIDEIYSRI